ncbi:hypothetical protein Bca52824_066998 [Brassica carinata]|uniref:Serine/threonine-protein kinase BSK n=1 Tax=Brassica carinata TaxID=52824 RepID=A0A8X7QMI7_BRACI|nr:hypothetical protein Bca52824_066998 [Brassica carinata]
MIKNLVRSRLSLQMIVIKRPRGQLLSEIPEFTLEELSVATDGFSADNIVSEHNEKVPNIVYEGTLSDGKKIAIKRFQKLSWPDASEFIVRP